jgi:alpha-methylacyl-CoA racemase
VSVGAIEPHFYANLCKALGYEEYAAHQYDEAKQDEIRKAFQEAFETRDRDDWVAELAPSNTCVAPVYTIPELVEDPHFRSRGIFMKAEHEEHGTFEQVGPILAGGKREQPLHTTRPPAETDAEALLANAGLGGDEIATLRNDGVVE